MFLLFSYITKNITLDSVLTPKSWRKTNQGGFYMKVTINEKIKYYDDWKNNKLTLKQINDKLGMKSGASDLRLLYRSIDAHGVDFLFSNEKRIYKQREKVSIVLEALNSDLSQTEICVKYGISRRSILSSWISKYDKLGYNGLKDNRGNPIAMKSDSSSDKKQKLKNKDFILKDDDTEIEKLQKQLNQARLEAEYWKKLAALIQKKKG